MPTTSSGCAAIRCLNTLLSAAGAVALLSACGPEQRDPATDGDRPPKLLESPEEFPTPFTIIRAVMALPDGRLVVSDPPENRVSLLDFEKGTSEPLGRIGEGPREYKQAAGLYRGRGGGVLVFDHELRRLLPVSASGAVQEVIGSPYGGTMAGGYSGRGPDDFTFDSLGNAYESLCCADLTAPTAVLIRQPPLPAHGDTVTKLQRPVTKALQVRRNRTGSYQQVLFSPEDAWAVAPDGRVVVVRATPYRVELFPISGPRDSGLIITHEQVRISKAEKAFIASKGPIGRIDVSVGFYSSPPPRSSRPAAPEPVPVKELLFAKYKTPINLRSGSWPLLDESGRLWVPRSLPFVVKLSVFDVFDRAGRLVDRVALPAGSRLVGFDPHWLYAARIDADDFEHLQRFPLPQ